MTEAAGVARPTPEAQVKRVCVIGNFSGRNAGDAAILGGLLDDVHALYPDCVFDVPTINPGFVRRTYAGFPVRPVGMLPWNLSLKILGLPVFRSVLGADLVLVTDAILFDLKLLNPLFNYLSTMALVLPLAKRRGIPVVLYNVSLGPVKTRLGAVCMRRVVDASDKIIVRDAESRGVMEQVGRSGREVLRGADCALNVRPAPPEKVRELLKRDGVDAGDAPFATFNVNSYLNVFVRDGGACADPDAFAGMMAAAADRISAELGIRLVVVVTQPMDMRITEAVLVRMKSRAVCGCAVNPKWSYSDLAGLFALAGMHIGMRTHSLILASSVLTPVVGIIATPKNRGFMRSIGQDARMMEFPDLTEDSLVACAVRTWETRDSIRGGLVPVIAREKALASASAGELAGWLEKPR